MSPRAVHELARWWPIRVYNVSSFAIREAMTVQRLGRAAKPRQFVLTLVALVLGDLLGDVLDLEQQLDTLNWRYGGLRDGSGHTAGDEVLGERHWIRETGHFVVWVGVRRVNGLKNERKRGES